MSYITIMIDTGFPNAIHEEETEITIEEWHALTHDKQKEFMQECINNYVYAYAVDDAGEDLE